MEESHNYVYPPDAPLRGLWRLRFLRDPIFRQAYLLTSWPRNYRQTESMVCQVNIRTSTTYCPPNCRMSNVDHSSSASFVSVFISRHSSTPTPHGFSRLVTSINAFVTPVITCSDSCVRVPLWRIRNPRPIRDIARRQPLFNRKQQNRQALAQVHRRLRR